MLNDKDKLDGFQDLARRKGQYVLLIHLSPLLSFQGVNCSSSEIISDFNFLFFIFRRNASYQAEWVAGLK